MGDFTHFDLQGNAVHLQETDAKIGYNVKNRSSGDAAPYYVRKKNQALVFQYCVIYFLASFLERVYFCMILCTVSSSEALRSWQVSIRFLILFCRSSCCPSSLDSLRSNCICLASSYS